MAFYGSRSIIPMKKYKTGIITHNTNPLQKYFILFPPVFHCFLLVRLYHHDYSQNNTKQPKRTKGPHSKKCSPFTTCSSQLITELISLFPPLEFQVQGLFPPLEFQVQGPVPQE